MDRQEKEANLAKIRDEMRGLMARGMSMNAIAEEITQVTGAPTSRSQADSVYHGKHETSGPMIERFLLWIDKKHGRQGSRQRLSGLKDARQILGEAIDRLDRVIELERMDAAVPASPIQRAKKSTGRSRKAGRG